MAMTQAQWAEYYDNLFSRPWQPLLQVEQAKLQRALQTEDEMRRQAQLAQRDATQMQNAEQLARLQATLRAENEKAADERRMINDMREAAEYLPEGVTPETATVQDWANASVALKRGQQNEVDAVIQRRKPVLERQAASMLVSKNPAVPELSDGDLKQLAERGVAGYDKLSPQGKAAFDATVFSLMQTDGDIQDIRQKTSRLPIIPGAASASSAAGTPMPSGPGGTDPEIPVPVEEKPSDQKQKRQRSVLSPVEERATTLGASIPEKAMSWIGDTGRRISGNLFNPPPPDGIRGYNPDARQLEFDARNKEKVTARFMKDAERMLNTLAPDELQIGIEAMNKRAGELGVQLDAQQQEILNRRRNSTLEPLYPRAPSAPRNILEPLY